MTQKHKPNCLIYLCTCMTYATKEPVEKKVFCREVFRNDGTILCEACKKADEIMEAMEPKNPPPPEDSL